MLEFTRKSEPVRAIHNFKKQNLQSNIPVGIQKLEVDTVAVPF